MASVAIPESGEAVPAETARLSRAVLFAFVGVEVAWIVGLGYLLIRVLLLG